MEEEGGDDYPCWQQSTTNLRRPGLRPSSTFFNLCSLLLLLLFLFLVFAIPSLIRHSSQNFKPSLVKKSWDWINLVLVLFALAFGFLSRIRNENRYQRTGSGSSAGAPKSNLAPNQQWCGFSDQTVGELRRNRNCSSYPDLRELSVAGGGDQWRFSDDTHLNSYRVWDSDHPYRRPSWKELDRQNSVTKVDDLVNLPTKVSYAPPPRSPSPPPPRSPPPQPQPPVTSARPPAPPAASLITSQKPPMPEKNHNIEDWPSRGESAIRHMIPPPPAPPLPPFKMADLKYVVEGDYARLLSINSFRNGSPEPLFCPSPDVDTKAGSFIAKVRARLKLEKLFSFNQKQSLIMSKLGPNSGSSSQF